MFDYRNNLKRILNQTAGDEKSLSNGLAAIKLILGMADEALGEPIISTQVDYKQVDLFLRGLIALIKNPGDNHAKNNTLKAIRQILLTPKLEIGLRQTLIDLSQAVKASQTTKETINKKVFEQALQKKITPKVDYRKGKRYIVVRLLSGCDLVNDSKRCVFTLKESQIHSLNLKSGDIVEALPVEDNRNYEAEILRVVGFRQLSRMEVDQISTFKYAVVQGNSGHLTISHNIKGQKLRIRGKSITLSVDESKFEEKNIPLTDGSIVDLAWYDGDIRLKKNPTEAIEIRWIYELDQPATMSKLKKKKVKQIEQATEMPKLALNLHYQRVGIAIGNNQNEALLEGIVKRYNGIPIAIDAFQGKKKIIEQQIKNLDIVILVTAFAAHDSTWNISEFTSKYNVKFAVSSSKGYQAFERALYRAEMGLPAYEGNQTIEYKKAN